MINAVTVTCDRCGRQVDGCESVAFTGGFYRRGAWEKFFNDGEEIVCDRCMWSDPRYIEVFGLPF